MAPLLDIVGLHQVRGYRHVLKGIDLTVEHGEIIGLIGRNGSGKSTLAQTVGGAVAPRSGTMTLDGEPYAPEDVAAARAAGVSVIEQDFAVPPGLRVVENVFRHTPLAGRPLDELLERGREILARTHFDLDLARPLDELDPAGQALAEVLRVHAEGARLVIFDEVSAVLNDLEIAQLHAAARHLRDQGCSIIHVAHRLEEITALSDRVAVLRGGVVVQVVDAVDAAAGELVRAMLGRDLDVPERLERQGDEVVYAVDGLRVPDRVEPLSLELHSGEVLGVVGLRQSGAVELAQALAGRIDAEVTSRVLAEGDDGRVAYVAGPSPDSLEQRQADVLTTGQEHLGAQERMKQAFVRAIEHDMETSNLNNPVKSLSGGDRQKASIVAVAETAATVVVLEHPTRGVDVGAKEMAYRVIERLVARGKALVVLTSDLTEVLRISDRIAVMHEGSLVAVLDASTTHEDLIMSYAMTGAEPAEEPQGADGAGSRGARRRAQEEAVAVG